MESTSHLPKGWLLLLYSLPAQKASSRVNLWRKLKKTGAYLLKTSAYILPDEATHLERFQWLVQQVREEGGEATLARVKEIEGLSDADIIRLFNDARTQDYRALNTQLHDLLQSKANGKKTEFEDGLEKLHRQFRVLQSIDFFECPAGRSLERLFQEATQSSLSGHVLGPVLSVSDYQRRIWLTRPQPGVDRVGSAWLIRNYIDPEATFVFGTDPAQYPEAIPFDMMEVEFTHHGEDCTFETLIRRFEIQNSGLTQIAEIIHDADVEDDKFQRTEGRCLDLLFRGWADLGMSDLTIMEKGFLCFDGLFTALARSDSGVPIS